MRMFVLLLLVADIAAAAEMVTVDADAAAAYVRSCRKPNGAFGPADQEYTDAAWNFPAVGTLLLLGETIEEPQRVLDNGLGYPHGHGGYGHWLFWHQHGIRHALGKPITPERHKIELVHQGYKVNYYGSPFGVEAQFKAGSGSEPSAEDVGARQLGYYNLSSLYYLIEGLSASDREPTNFGKLTEFIMQRQAPGGGFVDLRTAEAKPLDEDAHVAHSFHAVRSLRQLGNDGPLPDRYAEFIHRCQLENGAFRCHPTLDDKSNVADVYYTWAALRALEVLHVPPRKKQECLSWLASLQNADGGFGDRPGWRSRLYSTYYAVHAREILAGDARKDWPARQVAKPEVERFADGRFRIYQGLFKLPALKPADMPGLAHRKFNLVATKTYDLDAGQALIEACQTGKLPLDVVLCPEAYPHRLRHGGGLVLDHVGNFTLDPRWTAAERATWDAANEAGKKGLPWSDYCRRVIGPMRKLGSLCYPEHEFEMEYGYTHYGDDGYNAMLAGFNWSPRDFVRVFPWRERYVDKLTMVADCDAHGDLEKWSPQLDHTRHLYLATGPSYADFLAAAANGRVVCVIAEPEGVPSGVSYYGRPTAVEYVKRHVDQWRWWKPK